MGKPPKIRDTGFADSAVGIPSPQLYAAIANSQFRHIGLPKISNIEPMRASFQNCFARQHVRFGVNRIWNLFRE